MSQIPIFLSHDKNRPENDIWKIPYSVSKGEIVFVFNISFYAHKALKNIMSYLKTGIYNYFNPIFCHYLIFHGPWEIFPSLHFKIPLPYSREKCS